MDNKKDTNLKKLSKTSIPMNFVKKNKGEWNHDSWLEFCSSLEEKNYTPIDFDKVGELLEEKKKAYFNQKNKKNTDKSSSSSKKNKKSK